MKNGEGAGGARKQATIIFEDEAVVVDVSGVVRSTGDEELDETEEEDEGSDEGGDGSEFGESDDVERGGVSDLIALTMEEVVSQA